MTYELKILSDKLSSLDLASLAIDLDAVHISDAKGDYEHGHVLECKDTKPGACTTPTTPKTPVPEPSIIALFAAGLFGIGFARRRQS